MSAASLVREYMDQQVRADLKYGHQRVRVTGTIAQIVTVPPTAFTPTVYSVSLGDRSFPTIGLHQVTVYCTFDKTKAAAVAALDRGHELTAECTCEGLQLTVQSYVSLTACDIVPPHP